MFFFKQKTAYEMRISDWSSDVCSSDLIFRRLVADAEVLVRQALAANLKTTADLPHDLAVALARDVDSVSLPVLKYSEVLTDDDLIEIVQIGRASCRERLCQYV